MSSAQQTPNTSPQNPTTAKNEMPSEFIKTQDFPNTQSPTPAYPTTRV